MVLENIILTREEKENILPYKTIVILIIILKDLFDLYLNYRQYKRVKENRPIPKELISIGLDQKKHEESNKYSKAKLEYKIVSNLFQNTLDLLLLYFNFYPLEYNISKSLCKYIPLIHFNPENEYGPLNAFIILEVIRAEIISLPFETYETFVLEEKFGFNKTTVKTFITDQIKTVSLFCIFIPPIMSLLVFIIIKGGKYFYLFTEIFFIILVFLFMWIFPNFIQPLFYTFKDIENNELKDDIYNLAKKIDYPLKKIYEMDASQRSSHSNAYLFGFGKNKRIVLFDTLIKKLTKEEIVGVLGHELGHWKKSHNIYNLIFIFVLFFILFFSLQFFLLEQTIFVNFGFEQKSVFIGLYLFFIMISPIFYFMIVLQFYMTRKFEYQADKFSCELGYGEELKSSLKKLSEENKSNLDPDPLYSTVNHSHPTLIERIRAINRYQESKKNK